MTSREAETISESSCTLSRRRKRWLPRDVERGGGSCREPTISHACRRDGGGVGSREAEAAVESQPPHTHAVDTAKDIPRERGGGSRCEPAASHARRRDDEEAQTRDVRGESSERCERVRRAARRVDISQRQKEAHEPA